jgi:DNA-binding transcriptional regulator GbsR (MarR family)
MTPGELAEVTGVSISTISDVLRNLRNIDLVRYEVKTNRHEYWLKDPSVLEVIFKLEKFVQTIRILG